MKAIQQRLRQRFGASMTPGQRFDEVPLVVFDEVAGLPAGCEALVAEVLRALKRRGWRVAHVVRQLAGDSAEVGAALADGPDAAVTVGEGRLVISRALEDGDALEVAMAAVGEGYDVVIGQNFGFAVVPRILMTRRVQEGFNLGLPNIVAYVSDGELDVALPRFTALDVEALADFIEQTLGLERPLDISEE